MLMEVDWFNIMLVIELMIKLVVGLVLGMESHVVMRLNMLNMVGYNGGFVMSIIMHNLLRVVIFFVVHSIFMQV